MNNKLESSIKYLIFAVAAVVISLIVTTVFCDVNNINSNLVAYDVDLVNKAQIRYPDGSLDSAELPIVVNGSEDITVSYNLSNISDFKNKSAALFVFYNDITCYVDGAEVYRYHADQNHTLKSGGYSVHIFDLPEKIEDKKLIIQFHCNLKLSQMIKLKTIDIGDRHSIYMYHLLRYDIVDYLVILFLLAVFVAMIILTLFYSKEHYFKSELTGLGIICLTISLYLLPQLWTYNYLLFDYRILTYVTEYFMLMLFFPAVLFILRGNLDPKFDVFFDIGMFVSAFNVILQTLMVLFTDYEFVDVNLVSMLIVSANLIIVATAFILTDVKKYSQKKPLLISMLPPLVTYAVSMIIYFATHLVMHINYILIGILFFILIQVYQLFKKLRRYKKRAFRARFIKNWPTST